MKKILVAGKPPEVYAHAVLVALGGADAVALEGLGRQCGKVIGVAKSLSDMGVVRILDIQTFELDGTRGVRVLMEKVRR